MAPANHLYRKEWTLLGPNLQTANPVIPRSELVRVLIMTGPPLKVHTHSSSSSAISLISPYFPKKKNRSVLNLIAG